MAQALLSYFVPISSYAECTFSKSDWEILSHFWYPIAFSREIQDQPKAIVLLDQKLVVFRHSKGMTVARNLCLHRGVPLSMGWVEGDELVCKYHGFRYDSTGQCIDIPAHPGGVIPPKLCLETFPTQEKYGLIWTCLDAEAPVALPDFPEWDDANYVQVLPNSVDINAAAGRQMEGFLDVAHFAWIHADSFADRSNPVVSRYEVEPRPHGLLATYDSSVSNYPHHLKLKSPPGFVWRRIFEVFFPFSARLTVKFPDNGNLCILNACCPISARKTRLFVPIARDFDKALPEKDACEFNHQIFAEDQEIVERQYPEDLPLDLTEEVHIKADRTSIEYRKALGKLGLGRMYTA